MANNDITYVRPEVRAAMPVWKKIRDVCKGADAVKAAGNEYLPFLDPSDKSARNKKRNADYIQRAVFYAITGNTKVGLLGLAFRKDPTMTAPMTGPVLGVTRMLMTPKPPRLRNG